MRWKSVAPLAVWAALLGGCASPEAPRSASRRSPAPSTETEPSAAERIASTLGSPRIKISLGSQRAYFYKGGEQVASTRISTGKPGFSTPRGSFKITQKEVRHISGTYGKIVDASGSTVNADADSRKDSVPDGGRFVGAPMPYFMRFNHGIGMHAGYVPDYPASHGCVRLPRQMAQVFFAHAPVGTPVTVTD